jgi:Lipopolysaccharide-assembly
MTTVLAAPVATKHIESLSVTVTGGSETSALGASKISNEDFAEAVKNSIAQSGLFAKIVPAGQSDYQLEVQIVRLDQPMFGTSFTVNLEATWRLVHPEDQKVVWEKAITSSSTATMSDAFSGVTRLRLANEGAARNNIQDAIAQMSALSLP